MSKDQLITQEELDILTSSMAIAEATSGTRKQAEVALYDFRDAAKLSPDQIHELEDRCTVLSKVLSRTLTAYLNTASSVDFEGLDHPTFDQYIRGLPPNPIMAIVQLDPHSPPAVWQFDAAVAVPLLSTMLGATRVEPGSPSHELTPIEVSLLTRLVDEILHTWTLTWPALEHISPRTTGVSSTVATLDISSSVTHVIHATFRFHVGDVSGPANLALPLASVMRILRTDSDSTSSAIVGSSEGISPTMTTHAARSVVRLSVEIARLRLPLRELSSLKPGQLLSLNHHISEPLTLCIAGTPKFHAESGEYLARMAARIVGPIETI